MSIYATHWILRFPRDGDHTFGCEWVTVRGQGVPGHIGMPTPGHGYEDGDPYAAFVPPPVEIDPPDEDAAAALRAMVIVREGTEKVGQEHVRPLLALPGDKYRRLTFEQLHDRICDALRGSKPRAALELFTPDGEHRTFFEDSTVRGDT